MTTRIPVNLRIIACPIFATINMPPQVQITNQSPQTYLQHILKTRQIRVHGIEYQLEQPGVQAGLRRAFTDDLHIVQQIRQDQVGQYRRIRRLFLLGAAEDDLKQVHYAAVDIGPLDDVLK